ncbi:MAG: sugar kinase, partial [Sideroxyarcus sp.]|nr:sugar kinase [Sideroxyarcus sp.]
LEYHGHGGASRLRYGGDTLNTAIHMARMGQDVAYVTAVGTDPISDALVAAWADEGIDTRYVLRHPSRSPGIYAINVDAQGERSFLYWRERSAAREMFALPEMDNVLVAALDASVLYFSLISLAILPQQGRKLLLDLATANKGSGKIVAYDSNFRANLWASNAEALAVSVQAIAAATLGLPTNVDEQQLHGRSLPAAAIAALWIDGGCDEVVVKAGEAGCHFATGDSVSMDFAVGRIDPVDTSGAGDAFNAGYLSARLDQLDPAIAVAKGQALARWVIARSGAIPPREAAASYSA